MAYEFVEEKPKYQFVDEPTQITPEARQKHFKESMKEFGAGATSIPRGIFNLLGGDWTPQVDKESGSYLTGQFADPVSWFGGAKIAQGVSKLPGLTKGIQNILSGTLAGGASGGLVDSTDRGSGAVTGAAGGFGASTLFNVFGRGGNALGNVIGPVLSKGSAEKAAARIVNEAAGELQPNVVNALRSGQAGQTASQAMVPSGSAESVALMELMKGKKGSAYDALSVAQEQGRKNALAGITPDLKQAEGTRAAAANPLYQQAKAQNVTLDADMMDIFSRMPSNVMSRAQDIARVRGVPFMVGQYQPATTVMNQVVSPYGQIINVPQSIPAQFPKTTGESLHSIKLALSDIANAKDPSTVGGQEAQRAARGVLNDYIAQFEKHIPAYGQARATFAKESAPVNQAQVLGKMGQVLDTGSGTERVGPFLNALGSGEQALLKRSTGYPRYEQGDLKNVLSPIQSSVVDDIVRQLKTNQAIERMSTAGREGALSSLRAVETMPNAPNLMTWKVSLPNSILNRIEGKGGEKTNKALAEMGLPQGKVKLADLMEQQKRRKLLMDQIMLSGSGITGGITGGLLTAERE